VPVSDVDRAKKFYTKRWRLDADVVVGDDFRVVQLTPPRSQAPGNNKALRENIRS
jgi:hypothetical protein